MAVPDFAPDQPRLLEVLELLRDMNSEADGPIFPCSKKSRLAALYDKLEGYQVQFLAQRSFYREEVVFGTDSNDLERRRRLWDGVVVALYSDGDTLTTIPMTTALAKEMDKARDFVRAMSDFVVQRSRVFTSLEGLSAASKTSTGVPTNVSDTDTFKAAVAALISLQKSAQVLRQAGRDSCKWDSILQLKKWPEGKPVQDFIVTSLKILDIETDRFKKAVGDAKGDAAPSAQLVNQKLLDVQNLQTRIVNQFAAVHTLIKLPENLGLNESSQAWLEQSLAAVDAWISDIYASLLCGEVAEVEQLRRPGSEPVSKVVQNQDEWPYRNLVSREKIRAASCHGDNSNSLALNRADTTHNMIL